MSREEQLEDAARISIFTHDELSMAAYISGARWADTHPNWHKYPDEKPTKDDRYLVAYGDGSMYIMAYRVTTDRFESVCISPKIFGTPIAWMELPKPPKFD